VSPNFPPRSPLSGVSARRPNRFPWLSVLLLGVLSLLPRLWLSATRAIDYDGYWHVFVAGQDRWANFIAGVWSNAHPPLFYLLLRGVMAFGRAELSFRLVSLLAGLGAVIAGARLAWRMGRNAMVTAWAAAAFASCFAPVVLSIEVRSYMLALFFILVSFGGYLDLLDGSESRPPPRATAVFVGGAGAAVCAHYFALLYLLACLLLTAVVALVNPAVRARVAHRARSHRRMFVWSGAFLALVGGLALVHAAYRAPRLNHLTLYMFESDGRETLTRFLARNLLAEFNLFSPLALSTDTPVAAVGLAAALALAAVWWLRRLRQADRVAALLPAGAFLTILLLIIGASIAGRYPFGGAMRQQSILFAFLVPSMSGLSAGLLSKLGTFARALCGMVLFLGLAVNSARQLPTYESYYPASFVEADRALSASFPGATLLYTDQFGVVAFFSRRFDWEWSYRMRVPGDPELLWYRLRRGRDTLDVVEDRTRWVARLDATPLLYRSLRSALRAASSRCLVLYRLVPPEVTGFGADEPQERIERAARAEGLALGREVRFGSNRLLEVCLPEPAPSASAGRGGEPAIP
jgi:hypothetical protein